MEDKLRKTYQTQNELVEATRILADILSKMGNYLYNHTSNPILKRGLKELGEEIKQIKTPRKR